MDRKPYQEAALSTLAQFARGARDQGPHLAFGAVAPQEPAYRDQGFGATPYVCLRSAQASQPRPMVMFTQDDDGATIRRALEDELQRALTKLSERKVIERAKGIVM